MGGGGFGPPSPQKTSGPTPLWGVVPAWVSPPQTLVPPPPAFMVPSSSHADLAPQKLALASSLGRFFIFKGFGLVDGLLKLVPCKLGPQGWPTTLPSIIWVRPSAGGWGGTYAPQRAQIRPPGGVRAHGQKRLGSCPRYSGASIPEEEKNCISEHFLAHNQANTDPWGSACIPRHSERPSSPPPSQDWSNTASTPGLPFSPAVLQPPSLSTRPATVRWLPTVLPACSAVICESAFLTTHWCRAIHGWRSWVSGHHLPPV